jgi:hypothetical protein
VRKESKKSAASTRFTRSALFFSSISTSSESTRYVCSGVLALAVSLPLDFFDRCIQSIETTRTEAAAAERERRRERERKRERRASERRFNDGRRLSPPPLPFRLSLSPL